MDATPPGRLRSRWSWISSALGLVLILAGVLRLTSATVGGRIDSFAERRTYTEVKRAAHAVYPSALVLGLAGLGLMILGARLRSPRE